MSSPTRPERPLRQVDWEAVGRTHDWRATGRPGRDGRGSQECRRCGCWRVEPREGAPAPLVFRRLDLRTEPARLPCDLEVVRGVLSE